MMSFKLIISQSKRSLFRSYSQAPQNTFVFDTETTTFPPWGRLVQIACRVFDPSGELISEQNHIVLPQGFKIPASAALIHGITTDYAKENGKPITSIWKSLAPEIRNCKILVAHNMKFDDAIISLEMARSAPELLDEWKSKERICTMTLARKHGVKGKLSVMHRQFFGIDFDESKLHTADFDTQLCSDIFFHLNEKKELVLEGSKKELLLKETTKTE